MHKLESLPSARDLRAKASNEKVQPLNMENLVRGKDIFEVKPQLLDSKNKATEYQMLYVSENDIKFNDKKPLSLLISSFSDFLKLDISFSLINQDSGHEYQPQFWSEG